MNPVEATYRAAARVPVGWLTAAPAASAATVSVVPIPGFDEDEATLAVAAAEPLLAAAHLAAWQLRRVALTSRTGSGLGRMVASALGVPAERVEEAAAILYGQTRFPAPGEGPVLQIQTDAPRPGRIPPDGPGAGALAVARLSGPNVPADRTIDVAARPWTPDADQLARMAKWEDEAPRRVPMGAFIPPATWERSAPARYRLEASHCGRGHVDFPPRPRCGTCAGAVESRPLPRPGTLESFTVVAKGAAPSEFEPLQEVAGEYAVGVARFGAARVPGLFTETPLDSLRIGMKVETTFRRLYALQGEWRYGLKFRAPP